MGEAANSDDAPAGKGKAGWKRPGVEQTLALVAAFCTYFCMYAFRKPFAAGSFDGELAGLSVKTLFVLSQLVGYALSKYAGIFVVAGLAPSKRVTALLSLILLSWLLLFFFALGSPVLGMLCLFGNGLCLGMVWGIVVSFLEGRASSELLLAGLSCSFIVASGAVKDVARYLMHNHGVTEAWMPFFTGALFVLPLIGSVALLSRVRPPSSLDVRLRSERTPMSHAARKKFALSFRTPLTLLLVCYFFLTAFRDYRDNYGVELYAALGHENNPALFTQTELPVALFVLLAMAALWFVRSNRLALLVVHGVMAAGLLLLSLSTWLLQAGWIEGALWMFLLGLGSYLAYVPFGSVLFDRMVAHTRVAGNAVFGIYLADSLGYTGSLLVQLYDEFFSFGGGRLEFFVPFCHALGLAGAGCLMLSAASFVKQATAQQGTVSTGHAPS